MSRADERSSISIRSQPKENWSNGPWKEKGSWWNELSSQTWNRLTRHHSLNWTWVKEIGMGPWARNNQKAIPKVKRASFRRTNEVENWVRINHGSSH